jgi:hypothetical protein
MHGDGFHACILPSSLSFFPFTKRERNENLFSSVLFLPQPYIHSLSLSSPSFVPRAGSEYHSLFHSAFNRLPLRNLLVG